MEGGEPMIGKFPAKLDDKNRLFVPAKLRAELGEDFYVTLGVNCGHRCLTVYTAAEWQQLSDNFNALSIQTLGRYQPDFYECRPVQP